MMALQRWYLNEICAAKERSLATGDLRDSHRAIYLCWAERLAFK